MDNTSTTQRRKATKTQRRASERSHAAKGVYKKAEKFWSKRGPCFYTLFRVQDKAIRELHHQLGEANSANAQISSSKEEELKAKENEIQQLRAELHDMKQAVAMEQQANVARKDEYGFLAKQLDELQHSIVSDQAVPPHALAYPVRPEGWEAERTTLWQQLRLKDEELAIASRTISLLKSNPDSGKMMSLHNELVQLRGQERASSMVSWERSVAAGELDQKLKAEKKRTERLVESLDISKYWLAKEQTLTQRLKDKIFELTAHIQDSESAKEMRKLKMDRDEVEVEFFQVSERLEKANKTIYRLEREAELAVKATEKIAEEAKDPFAPTPLPVFKARTKSAAPAGPVKRTVTTSADEASKQAIPKVSVETKAHKEKAEKEQVEVGTSVEVTSKELPGLADLRSGVLSMGLSCFHWLVVRTLNFD